MREIVVNGRFLGRRITGVERYASEILKHAPAPYRLERPAYLSQGLRGHTWEQLILPARLGQDSILWSPANTGPLLVRDQVLTLHDLGPLEHPEWFQPSFAIWYRMVWPALIRRTRKVLVPSKFVKRRLAARFSSRRVVVISEGVDLDVFRPGAARPRLPLPQRYVLFVGSIGPRKNLPGLLQAWQRLRHNFDDTWLVIAGAFSPIFRQVNIKEHMERVVFLGRVPEADLPGLYANATLFVLPSFEEGFGLPALEAMASGIPVLSSDGGALPETVGEAGLIFPLSDPCGLEGLLSLSLSSQSLRSRMREAGLMRAREFPWQQAAAHIWDELHAQ